MWRSKKEFMRDLIIGAVASVAFFALIRVGVGLTIYIGTKYFPY